MSTCWSPTSHKSEVGAVIDTSLKTCINIGKWQEISQKPHCLNSTAAASVH